MKHNEKMFVERNALLKAYIASGISASMMLKLTEPMVNMTEEEKEAFAKSLRLKLEAEFSREVNDNGEWRETNVEAWNAAEKKIINKMDALNFPESVKTTVIWATREAPDSAAALTEVDVLLDKKPTGKEMTRAVQPMLKASMVHTNTIED